MSSETFVLVGGGLTAAKAAEGLRGGGFDGRIVLVGAEPHLPYERPPLSKGYLLGTEELESAFVQPPSWYDEHEVELHLATRATAVALDAHTVVTTEGEVGFDRLLLATGSVPRPLPVEVDGDPPVAYLRTIEDSRRLRQELQPGRRVVIVGGGWIGLEVAAAARTAGCDVVVLEALDLPLVRVLGPEVAEAFRALHASHGVDLRTRTTLTSVGSDGGRAVVHLETGSRLVADLLVVAVGAAPETAVAEAAGLETGDGVVVDERLRTSHQDVFAAGDVANAYHPLLGRHVRVEHWDNAVEQGLAVAANMLGGDRVYDRLPYFYTDQYDLGMEYVGHVGPDGADEVVVLGEPSAGAFTAFWVASGRVLAGMHANDWDAMDPIRRIVGAGQVDLARLRDPGTPLEQVT